MIKTEDVKALRDKTGISVMQCKKALEEAKGDPEKALLLLKKKAGAIASKKSDRTLGAGAIASYIHSTNQIGTLVELSCETDFVAKNEEFVTLAHDIAMHIAGAYPEYVSEADINKEDRAKVKEMFAEEVNKSDKPEDIKEKMLQGKIDAYFKERVLMKQAFIKDPEKTIEDLVNDGTHKFGERMEVARFERYVVGG